jgi:hypothetical protein
MKNLKKTSYHFFKNYWPLIFFLILLFIFYWKVFLLKYIALPADILVKGSYPVKNPITSDAVSFSYPMKYLVVTYLKNGVLPLWNPYILFGTPLLANFQSGVFSVTNIFYFLTDFNSAWNFQIISQHFLAFLFTYILLRYWKISKIGSFLGGISFAFGGFNLIWSEWNAHALTASYIPLLIYFIDKLLQSLSLRDKFFYGTGLSVGLAFQIFSGYPQIVLYTIPALFILCVIRFKYELSYFVNLILFLIFISIGVGIAAPQILPGQELLKLSQRSYEIIPKEWAFLSWRQVITFIAPDFYGNHATSNYWGDKNYTSNIGFVGVITFTLAILTAKYFRKRKEILFLLILIIISLVLSLPTPIAVFLWDKDILGLKAGAFYRILVLFSFAMSALAGFGYDYFFIKEKRKYIYLLPIVFILIVFWIYGFSLHNNVALRNLILPSGVFIIICLVFRKTKFKFLLVILTIIELFYFGWKFTPFVPRSIVFPSDKIVNYIKALGGEFRVVGGNTIAVDTNMVYEINFSGGYDAEYSLNTAKFLGVLNSDDPSATPQDRYGLITNYKSRLLDLTNTRFVLNDEQIIENKDYLPRSFKVNDFVVEKDGQKVFDDLLNKKFPINKTVILDKDPKLDKGSSLYFISDTFYPGWKAYIDNKETEIFKADYAFQAIRVPNNTKDIELIYKPESFYNGLKISLGSLIFLLILHFLLKLIPR